MSKPKILPDDVRGICIQLVRGYDRRVQEYKDRRMEIISGSACRWEEIIDPEAKISEGVGTDPKGKGEKRTIRAYTPSAHWGSRVSENIAERLTALDDSADVKRLKAVERAMDGIGQGMPQGMREKVRIAVIRNCKNGRRYPLSEMDVEGMSRRGLYRERERFLVAIAQNMRMI